MNKGLLSLFIDKYGLTGIIIVLFISYLIGVGTAYIFIFITRLVGAGVN